MAPEQIRGASRVDDRADLYSFAMVVFEALTGRLAYDAQGSIALIAQKLEKPARHIQDLARVPVPAGLDDLLARCLSSGPAARPASAADLLLQWESLGPATVAPSPQAASTRMSDPPTETGVTAAPTRNTTVQSRRGSRIALLVAAAALLASCVVLAVALGGRDAPPVAAVAGAAAAVGEAPASPTSSAPVDPPVASPTPLLQIPPVTLSASAVPPSLAGGPPAVVSVDIDAPAASHAPRPRPGKRTWTPAPGRPSRPPTEPQIVTEPRY
jgi:serine/threonine protein kinase